MQAYEGNFCFFLIIVLFRVLFLSPPAFDFMIYSDLCISLFGLYCLSQFSSLLSLTRDIRDRYLKITSLSHDAIHNEQYIMCNI